MTDFFVVLTVKGQMTTEHEIDNYTKGPTINGLVVRLLHQNLGSYVAEGSVGLRACFTWPKRFCQTEVNKFNF